MTWSFLSYKNKGNILNAQTGDGEKKTLEIQINVELTELIHIFMVYFEQQDKCE